MFAPLEQSCGFRYATQRPRSQRRPAHGEVAFDKRTGRFEVSVSPGPEQLHEGPRRGPGASAIVPCAA